MNKFIKQAFTLIELLVVIAIIGILSGLIVVSMSGVTQKATIAKAQVFSNSLRIGSYSSSYYHLAGKMDEVRIFHAVVPSAQIKEQYYSGLNSLLANGNIDAKEYSERINSIAINE